MASEDGSQTPLTGNSISTWTPTTPATSPHAQDQHTPYSKTENSSGRLAALPNKAEHVYSRLGIEASRYLLGPMPVKDFLDTYLPLPPDVLGSMPPCPAQEFENVPPNAPKEEALYTPLIRALNSLPSKFIFVDTHEVPEGGPTAGSMKPDIALYLRNLEQSYTHSNTAFANFATMELFLEVKRSASDDCFHDDKDEFISFEYLKPVNSLSESQKDKVRTLGQNACYATEIFARQHRQCVFSLMMFGSKIRFARWDRSGGIVSKAFDCRNAPELLCEFMWRLDHVSLETRGYDPTVEKHKGASDLVAFQIALGRRLCFELGLERGASETQEEFNDRVTVEVSKHIDAQHVSTISMGKGDHQVQYLISKPTAVPISVTGRSTRGYWAFQPQRKEICFVKDTWRKDVGAESEGSICQELYQAGVPNVPEIDCYGDVQQASSADTQRTITQDFISASWVKRALSKEYLQSMIVPHIHHRLVSKTAGLGLGAHKDMKELLGFARDMFDTVLSAYEKCGRLHRDISAGNVILVRDPKTNKRRAFIIDWEFSAKLSKPKGNNPYTLSGTWQFISHRLLMGKDTAPHRLDDDLESILWVIYWHLLVYYSYPNLSTEELAAILQDVFDSSVQKQARVTGGKAKVAYLMERKNFSEGLEAYPDVHPWLFGYAKYLFGRHMARNEAQEYAKITPSSPLTLLKETLDMVDKHRFDAAPMAPDWKKLRAYRALGQTASFPATLSASSIQSLAIGNPPSHGTAPAPLEADREAGRIRDQNYRTGRGSEDIEELDEQGDENRGFGRDAKRARIRSGSPSA